MKSRSSWIGDKLRSRDEWGKAEEGDGEGRERGSEGVEHGPATER